MEKLNTVEEYLRLLNNLGNLPKNEQTDICKYLCLNDLYFFMIYGLNRKDMLSTGLNREWLLARCREVQANPNGYLDLWSRGHFKAVDNNEIVPTLNGWKKHGDLKTGDFVFDENGKPIRVIATTETFYDSDCYKVSFNDGYSVTVSGDHLWEVGKKSRKRIRGTKSRRHYRDYSIKSTRALSKHTHEQDNRYSVKLGKAVQCEHKDLLIHPYVLGAWLGDGTSCCGGFTNDIKDNEIVNYIRQYGYRVERKKRHKCMIYKLMPKLRKLGVLNNKHIPKEYLRASVEQRTLLLQGLMDTDGTCDKRGTATFTQKKEHIARQVFELCNSLGLNPHIRRHQGIINNEIYYFYTVSFQAYKNKNIFKLKRKIARCKDGERLFRDKLIISIERTESIPTKCIQVDSKEGLYLIGEKFTPTHNSSIITCGLTIQNILNNPEITVGIFSFSNKIAVAFLRQIKRELESNEVLKSLFPDVLYQNPQKESPKWSDQDGLIVKRKGNPKESTIEAWGLIDSQPISKHYDLMVYDDVVTRDNISTPDMIAKTREAWELSLNLSKEGGVKRYIGTRYHFLDTYKTIMERGAGIPRIYPATDDGLPTGKPVLVSQAYLDEQRREQGVFTFSAQFLQNPVADNAQGFKKEWLCYYECTNERLIEVSREMNVYILVDPAGEKKKTNDYTVFVVLGCNKDCNYYLLDGVRDRLNLKEKADMLFELYRKWKPKGVAYEKYGMMADIQYIREKQDEYNFRFGIVEVGGRVAKNDRIRRLVPKFENKKIYLPLKIMKLDYQGKSYDFVNQFVEEEYLFFPSSIHDDMLDALSRIFDIKHEFPLEEEEDTFGYNYQEYDKVTGEPI